MSHLSRNERVKPKAGLLINALALGLILIFIGCESEPPQKAAPTVVRKKINTSDEAAGAKKAEAAKKSASKPTPATAKTAAQQDQAPKPKAAATAGTQSQKTSKPAAAPKPAPAKPTGPEPSKSTAKAGLPAETTGQTALAAADKNPAPAKTQTMQPGSEKTGPAPMQVASSAGKPPVIVVDPFEPLFQPETPKQQRPVASKPERPRRIPQTPLEKIDLGQLKLTAVIRTPAGNKALVEESSGKGYIIQKGTWIGVHAGRVQEITDDSVVVEEEIENALGEISLTKRELKLQKPPGD